MRRFYLTTLITIVSLIPSGCRQTTGPTGGPLTPLGPASALSPVGAGQSPALGPFGGTTRVTPPATGSYIAPNNYMGGVVPGGQASLGAQYGVNAPPGFESRNDIVGSGVQVANWNETNAVVGQEGTNVNSSTTRDPRSGGMQVIDLTGAPPPPGYRPTAPAFSNGFPGQAAPQVPNPNFQSPNVQNPNLQNRNFQNPGVQSPGFENRNLQNFGGGIQTINVPSPGEIANSQGLVPLREFPANAAPIGSPVPRTATAPGPSTEPVDPQGATGPNLPWRRPGSRL